ncbi:3-hydroxybutyryl-CoA dehydrogenase [Pseudoduganella sp. UC29_106]|uniref:3-hydroxybutyryl-CoA dehydrogenase n=1 Tax=Pseudoduganella sp. UC29_106 TaxID=3374553 RepID=UPI00375817A6
MELKSIGVIGAGIMGSGIAQVCAMAGRDVLLVDVSAAALDRSVSGMHEALARMQSKGRITEEEKSAALARIRTTTEYGDLADCDAIIEAATENEQLKLKILQRVEEVARPDAIIASNTSSISITKLASAGKKQPDRFIGMHFFNPVPVLNLVELIPGLQTSEATLESARELVVAIGKTPIVVKNSPGFAVNRILCPMINEAIFVLQEGLASAQDIDAGMKLGCSHPIGPLALADLIGLDTLLSVLDTFYTAFNDPKYRPATLLREMVDAGRLGRKSGRGFYHYF